LVAGPNSDLLGGVLGNLDRESGVTICAVRRVRPWKTRIRARLGRDANPAAVIRLTGSESDAELAYSGLASLTKALHEPLRDGSRTACPVMDDATAAIAAKVRGTPGNPCCTGGGRRADAAALLIDDAQWVDDASCAALAFALRRLPDEPVVAIIAERADMPSPFDNAGFETIDLKGLGIEHAIALLGVGTDAAVARRCVEASGGSPLALSEIARQLDPDQLAGRTPLPTDLTDGDHLIRSFVDRIDALDPGARRAVAVVAAALDTTVADIRQAAAQGFSGDDDLWPATPRESSRVT
jgi:hypothetical protein